LRSPENALIESPPTIVNNPGAVFGPIATSLLTFIEPLNVRSSEILSRLIGWILNKPSSPLFVTLPMFAYAEPTPPTAPAPTEAANGARSNASELLRE
jgi:hypothetical protein